MDKLEGHKPVSSPKKSAKTKAGATAEVSPAAQQLTLERYAALKNITVQEAWRHVHSGQILARFEGDEIFIYLKADEVPPTVAAPVEENPTAGLVPLPQNLPSLHSVPTSSAQVTELALLIDHLSLAKEENLEILKMSQATIAELRSTYESTSKFKDQALAEEKARSEKLAKQLDEHTQLVNDLKQQIEDLKMLEKMR